MNHNIAFDSPLCLWEGFILPLPPHQNSVITSRRHESEFQGRAPISQKFHEWPDFQPMQLTQLISSLLRPPTQAPCAFQAHPFDAARDSQRPPRLLPLSSPSFVGLSSLGAVGLTHFLHQWARLEDPAPRRARTCTQTSHRGVRECLLGCCYHWPRW